MFDKQVMAAAMKWKYQPATMDGVPVKFMKRLSITVSPTLP
jgi:outer membrane biosynthesis protein TonB